jgi:membrane protease YdiL (CAAX protease family)
MVALARPHSPTHATQPARAALVFLAIVLVATPLLAFPAILARHRVIFTGPPEGLWPFFLLAAFLPTIAAVLLARREGGAQGLRALVRPLGIWRVGLVWYLVALALPGTILVAGMAAVSCATGAHLGPWLYPPEGAQRVTAMLIVPLADQLAWRGFAFARLHPRLGSLGATLVIGLGWSLYHLEKHVFGGLDAEPASVHAAMVLMMTAGTVFYTWLERRTGGSLLVVVLAQMGAYLNNSTAPLPGNPTPLFVHAAGYAVVAVALLAADRRAFRSSGP